MSSTVLSIFTALLAILTALIASVSFFSESRRFKNRLRKLENYREGKEARIQTSIDEYRQIILSTIKRIEVEQTNQRILNSIINCEKNIRREDQSFNVSMQALATDLRNLFKSEYCAIGTIVDGIAEDYIIDYDKFDNDIEAKSQAEKLEFVRSANANNDYISVCNALKSSKNISFFNKEQVTEFENYNDYKQILKSHEIENTTIIPIRDTNFNNYGYIQFINSKEAIEYVNISPLMDAFLVLIQSINDNERNRKKENRLKDSASFYHEMQSKSNDIDVLLDYILEYFSKEFNATFTSFRIPILNGKHKEALFYLRRCYVSEKIERREAMLNYLYNSLTVKRKNDITFYNDLRCRNQDNIILADFSEDNLEQEFGFESFEKGLIVPILRDYNNLSCKNSQRQATDLCDIADKIECTNRFSNFYGYFEIRLSKKFNSSSKAKTLTIEEEYQRELKEIKERLILLSRQIAIIFNSIIHKYENLSLQLFQKQLKESSFIKIKEYDERCAQIIKLSANAKVCSIYRYDEHTKKLVLSSTTANRILFDGKMMDANSILSQCSISISQTSSNPIVNAYNEKQSILLFNYYSNTTERQFLEITELFQEKTTESALIIPLLQKDENTCIGIVTIIGKNDDKHLISTAYWEHDINHIKFFINVLTRISESDTERLTFLFQLSHELLAPITQLVYKNDLMINRANKSQDSVSKQQLFATLQENIDMSMLFKYIITDAEFIYSSNGGLNNYNIIKQDNPKDILVDSIRMVKDEALAKGLTIKTFTSRMPALYFDKERMMRVFINLLKNAVKYSDNHTIITISYSYDNNFHRIHFANFGIGILKEEKEAIFNLNYRGSRAKTKSIRGTGMGLYIVREIMRAHGGDCFVRRLNSPTEFVITIPNRY